MKKILLAAIAATTLFASCAKDNNNQPIEGESAKLVINVETPKSRAESSTAPLAADDKTITDFVIFVFDDQGVLEKRFTGTTSPAEITDGVTTKATDVYVIANAGDISTVVPETIKSKASLEAWIGDLNDNASQTSVRWATGKNAAALSFAKVGDVQEATTTATLTFISARITVNVVPMDDYDNTKDDGSLILTNVSVLNAGGATKLFASSLIPTAAELTAASFAGTPYYAGIDMTDMENVPTSYTKEVSFLSDDISGVAKAAFAGKYFYFYSFENNATTVAEFPVIVLIEGTYDGEAIYFPVHLAAYQQFSTGTTGAITGGVVRGNSYDITIKLTGKASKTTGGTYPGETGGEPDPTDQPKETAKLTVTLSINNWTPQVLVKEF